MNRAKNDEKSGVTPQVRDVILGSLGNNIEILQ